jgi:hypothetical protein
MTITNVTDGIKTDLKNTKFSAGVLDNCFNAKFLAIEENDSKIIGACFVGGVLNNMGFEIEEEFRGKGLSKKIIGEALDECKRRGISFVTGAFKPSNIPSMKTSIKMGFKPVFTFYYNNTEGKEIVVIRPINEKGCFFMNFARLGNTRVGNLCFAIFLKVSRPILKYLLAFTANTVPQVDLLYSFKNFEKVQTTLQQFIS